MAKDPILRVFIRQSQVAALQAAGQHFLADPAKVGSSLRRDVEHGIASLDQGVETTQ